LPTGADAHSEGNGKRGRMRVGNESSVRDRLAEIAQRFGLRMVPREPDIDVVTERAAFVQEMLSRIRALPLSSLEEFVADYRNVATAEQAAKQPCYFHFTW